jgi:hypothetical protein
MIGMSGYRTAKGRRRFCNDAVGRCESARRRGQSKATDWPPPVKRRRLRPLSHARLAAADDPVMRHGVVLFVSSCVYCWK